MPRPAFVVPGLPDPCKKGHRVSTKSVSKPDLLITETAAGEVLGVSKWTVRRLRQAGELAHVVVRGSIRIPTSSLEALRRRTDRRRRRVNATDTSTAEQRAYWLTLTAMIAEATRPEFSAELREAPKAKRREANRVARRLQVPRDEWHDLVARRVVEVAEAMCLPLPAKVRDLFPA